MKTVNLKILGSNYLLPTILIDNKTIKFKKNKFKNLVTTIETDKDELEVKIYTYHELQNDKIWLPMAIFFFIISIFGLLDLKDETKGKSLNYSGKIKLNEESNDVTLKLTTFENGKTAITCEGNCTFEDNESNKYYIDQKVIKRLKILKYVKLGIVLGLVLLALLIILI